MSGLEVTFSMVLSRNAWTSVAVEGAVDSARGAAEGVGLLDQVNGEALIREGQRGRHARDAAADDQGGVVDGHGLVFERQQTRRRGPTIMRTSSKAFCVAASASPAWTQEHCSRMLAISRRYGIEARVAQGVAEDGLMACAACTRPRPRG